MVTGSALIDAATAAYPAMAQFYAEDWAVLEAANEGYCPVSGCALGASATAGKVDVTAGVISAGTADVTVAAQTAQPCVATANATTVASGSNTVHTNTFAGSGVLSVASVTGFPTSGVVMVTHAGVVSVITYTNVSGSTFTGCTLVNGQDITMATSDVVAGSNADITNPKWAALELDSSGTLQLNLGTAAANPQKPTPTSARSLVAWIYIPANATAVDALTSNANGKAKIIEARQLTPNVPARAQVPYFESGCVWTADAAGSTKLASMSAGIVVIGGRRLRAAAVVSRTFTASKDTYIDAQDNSDGTALLTYTEVSNDAASPALANSGVTLNTARCAIIITGASSIPSTAQTDGSIAGVHQGSTFATKPNPSTAFSIPTVTDSLGNLIYCTTPQPRMIGHRAFFTNFATTNSTLNNVAAHVCPFIIPPGPARLVKVTIFLAGVSTSSAVNNTLVIYMYLDSAAVTLTNDPNPSVSNIVWPCNIRHVRRLTAGSHNCYSSFQNAAGGTNTLYASAAYPAEITVELV